MSLRLAETLLPLDRINDVSRREAGFIRAPKISNLHPYLARRPTSPARVLTLASILPSNTPLSEFNKAIGLDKVENAPYKILYLVNPDRNLIRELVVKHVGRKPEDIIIVDPMAGGGSIPLEALRMGFHTIAIDYNPVAYIILKATLEYPAKYGRKLYEKVLNEVENLLKYAKEELSIYYPKDAMNYIIARGVRCPNPKCRALVPLIHSTQLGKNGPYMKLYPNNESGGYRVEIVFTEPRFERLRCPHCGTPINKDIALKQWVKKHKELLQIALSGNIEEAKNKINELLETHIILVKETPEGFKPAGKEDIEAFIRAYLDLTQQIESLRDVLLEAPIPSDNRVFGELRALGIEKWYELFNPRQLLIISKLIKYVRTLLVQRLTNENDLTVPIAVYLSLGISKFSNFNNLATRWDYSTSTIENLTNSYLERGRQIIFGLEYCEMPPTTPDPRVSLGWVYEPHVRSVTDTRGGILPVLDVLSRWLEGLGDRIEVYCGDARKLGEILNERKVDVVNVDPPYLDQHFYSDLMEFFWQILRTALEHAIEHCYLFNRDPKKGKVELYIESWSPSLSTLPRESEIIVRDQSTLDIEKFNILIAEKRSHTGLWYVKKMWEVFKEINKILKDDGILVVWFTHSDPQAWEAVLASLYAAGYSLSRAWTVWTEMSQKRVALLTSAFLTSLILVLRKRAPNFTVITGAKSHENLLLDGNARNVIQQVTLSTFKDALNSGAQGPEIFIMSLAGGIAGATMIWNPDLDKIEERTLRNYLYSGQELEHLRFEKTIKWFAKVAYPVAIYVASFTILEDLLRKVIQRDDMVREILSIDPSSKVYLVLWVASRYSGTRELAYDFVEKVCKIMNVNRQLLSSLGLIKKTSKTGGYKLLFGNECYDAVNNRLDLLVKTSIGQAIHLLATISVQPRDDVSIVAKNVATVFPVSRAVIGCSMFLLRTVTNEELALIGASQYTQKYIEKVLEKLYEGV